MNKAFTSIKELLNTLNREQRLLTETFGKRKTLAYKVDFALELLDDQQDRLQSLLDYGIVRQNGPFLEIDDDYLQFFEGVLEANEEINVASIHATIQHIQENIVYYLQENNEHRKYNYLRTVKSSLRKIGFVTLRNVIDLKRNTENTFQSEPNYKIKTSKLQHLDQKRADIQSLIGQTENLVSEKEQTFFKAALDEELNQIIIHLRLQLNESRHNLLGIQRQIIEYLNQIKYQNMVLEKLRQLKYLKDQFTIRATTDIEQALMGQKALVFEPKPTFPLKLSIEFLQSDGEAFISLCKVAQKFHSDTKVSITLAAPIGDEYLNNRTEEEVFINLEELRDSFLAAGYPLFEFVMAYPFDKTLDFDEKVTIYCQLVSLYEAYFVLNGSYMQQQDIEYAVIYPK